VASSGVTWPAETLRNSPYSRLRKSSGTSGETRSRSFAATWRTARSIAERSPVFEFCGKVDRASGRMSRLTGRTTVTTISEVQPRPAGGRRRAGNLRRGGSLALAAASTSPSFAAADRAIRVCLIDDQTLFRESLASAISHQVDMSVVGQARSAEEGLQEVARMQPDAVLMDIGLPGIDGLEATRRIKAAAPSVKVIVITAYPNEERFRQALAVGVDSFLLKDASVDELTSTIRLTIGGSRLFDGSLLENFLSRRRRADLPGGLTTRELGVLIAMAAGHSNPTIAKRLRISEKTVRNHVSSIYAKLSVKGRTQAVLYAMRHGIVDGLTARQAVDTSG
jgi:NarL family two-component system response regulator LiaR